MKLSYRIFQPKYFLKRINTELGGYFTLKHTIHHDVF